MILWELRALPFREPSTVARGRGKKARGVAEELRRTTERAYMARWWSLLAIALQKAVTEAVLRESGTDLTTAEEQLFGPALADILDACQA